MKKIVGLFSAPPRHWVGDGFPVRSLFTYDSHAEHLSPFLMLDHAAPTAFTPTTKPRGVGAHPHRGFETVTIVLQGELAHRDSTGAGGLIGAGDVQWMTAAAGILHDEFHGPALTRDGGMLEMVQLWVNLPSAHKMAAPGYQTLLSADIPTIELPEACGTVRVIAGEYAGQAGPARTFTPIDVWELRLNAGGSTRLSLPEGHTLALVALRGSFSVDARAQTTQAVEDAQMLLLSRDGTDVVLSADAPATILVLSGEPIDEPIFGHGPFVMNTREEIITAFQDFQAGRFGTMPA